ncbi:MAG: ADP-dependent NAD(P)H-hydrate dehydratase / NAD(P)H-hydrate epimerase [Verrucomicrobiota bacterium]
MRAAEKNAFARGTNVESLMNGAGAGVARAVSRFFPTPARCIAFIGKGHNGGDALVAAAELYRLGWTIETRLIFRENDCSELTRTKLFNLRSTMSKPRAPAPHHSAIIVLDGLLGLGANPPLREPLRSACRDINKLRREQNAFVFAVDLPSGLDGDSGKADRDCVVADFTIAIGFAKEGLLADRAADLVGRLEVVSLPNLEPAAKKNRDIVASRDSLRHLLARRNFSAYKNEFGRVGIVAGSKGLTGAAVLCASGALRGGAGLVEVFVPEEIYPIVAAAAPAEAMVHAVKSYVDLVDQKIDIFAVGSGLGKSRAAEILELVQRARQPMVVDADALNILAGKTLVLKKCRGPRLLTPHPGEMKRIFPHKKFSRAQIAAKFCAKYPVTLLLKGSRTIVGERKKPLSYNATGNPGMATGGMGDVLTGICAALAAQGLSMYEAARLGAWVCGRAAEMSIFNEEASEESLLPHDVLDRLGAAFNNLRH